MRARRTAALAVLAQSVVVWGTLTAGTLAAGQAKTSKSASHAVALTKQLEQSKLQYIATKDPADPGRFVAAMHLPGSQLMIVSAKYASPALLNEKLLLGKFQDAYIDLNSASELASRVIVEDLRADGLPLTKSKDTVRDSWESGGKRIVFDFDWRKQKLSQEEYFSTLEAADTQYAKMLELLLVEAQKPR